MRALIGGPLGNWESLIPSPQTVTTRSGEASRTTTGRRSIYSMRRDAFHHHLGEGAYEGDGEVHSKSPGRSRSRQHRSQPRRGRGFEVAADWQRSSHPKTISDTLA